MSAFERMTPDEREVVRQCVELVLYGAPMDDGEVRTYAGCDRAEIEAVLDGWYRWYTPEERYVAEAVIHGCMCTVTGPLRVVPDIREGDRDVTPGQWNEWFSVSQAEVRETFSRYRRLRGLTHSERVGGYTVHYFPTRERDPQKTTVTSTSTPVTRVWSKRSASPAWSTRIAFLASAIRTGEHLLSS